jgi:flagellar biosynthetic protein FlhB
MRGDPRALGIPIFGALVKLMLPTAAAAMVVGTAVGFAEAGYNPRMELLEPKWERLNPITKLQQLFSPSQMLVNTALQIGRVVVVAAVAYYTLRAEFPMLTRLARAGLPGATVEISGAVFRLAVSASLALLCIAALDYAQSWFKHEKQIRMSRQELKDEVKQQEGDPAIRARQRARAREMAKRGLAKQVKGSDVIIANPTHISIALRYKSEEGAPVVAAKGVDDVALFMRTLAKEANIPIVVNVPLARALNDRVRAGRTIPVDLYTAVAEVLAVVYRLKSRR